MPGCTALTLQQFAKEVFGRTSIAARLNENVDHVAVLVYGALEILPASLDIDEEFIEMPDIAQPTLSSPECSGVFRTELQAPLSNGLVGNDDPTLAHQVFNIPETQTKSVVEPKGVANDIRRESISATTGRVGVHPPSLSGPPQLGNTSWKDYPSPASAWKTLGQTPHQRRKGPCGFLQA